MTVDSALGVSIPSHHAGDFAGEQNSLHTLVVKRESSEKGFPYLLGTQLLGRAVGVENFHSVGERGPEVLKAVIEDVFKRVTVVLIQCHPGIFFNVVDRNVCRGYKSAGKGAACQNPTKLDAEDPEEAVDMAGKVFIRLDTAAFKYGIVRWRVGFAPGAMTVVIAVGSATNRGLPFQLGSVEGSLYAPGGRSPQTKPGELGLLGSKLVNTQGWVAEVRRNDPMTTRDHRDRRPRPRRHDTFTL
jgi:hypothetical protein